jgi:hypothetical protein
MQNRLGLAVPRYFFHNHNSESQIDEVGIELPDEVAAKKEAIRATSEMLGDLGEAFWSFPRYEMRVVDAEGREVCRVSCRGT